LGLADGTHEAVELGLEFSFVSLVFELGDGRRALRSIHDSINVADNVADNVAVIIMKNGVQTVSQHFQVLLISL